MGQGIWIVNATALVTSLMGLDPSPGNFYMLQTQPKEKEKENPVGTHDSLSDVLITIHK